MTGAWSATPSTPACLVVNVEPGWGGKGGPTPEDDPRWPLPLVVSFNLVPNTVKCQGDDALTGNHPVRHFTCKRLAYCNKSKGEGRGWSSPFHWEGECWTAHGVSWLHGPRPVGGEPGEEAKDNWSLVHPRPLPPGSLLDASITALLILEFWMIPVTQVHYHMRKIAHICFFL